MILASLYFTALLAPLLVAGLAVRGAGSVDGEAVGAVPGPLGCGLTLAGGCPGDCDGLTATFFLGAVAVCVWPTAGAFPVFCACMVKEAKAKVISSRVFILLILGGNFQLLYQIFGGLFFGVNHKPRTLFFLC